MDPHLPTKTRRGSRFQSGIPTREAPSRPDSARGLKIRGVVVATYVTDDSNHPYGGKYDGAKGVYCDVVTYSSISGFRSRLLPSCLVLQKRSGMHSGNLWKPKAATMDVSDADLDPRTSNPANMDGDHVVVSFLDDSFSLPIIEGSIGHPNVDLGNEERDKGHRIGLKLADGDPDFMKHHGAFYGVDTNGDFVVNTTRANDGTLTEEGTEQDPPTDNKGSHRQELPGGAEHAVTFYDVSVDPPEPKFKLTMSGQDADFKFEVEFVDDASKVTFKPDEVVVDIKGSSTTTCREDSVLVDVQGTTFEVTPNDIQAGGNADAAVLFKLLDTELKRLNGEITTLVTRINLLQFPLPDAVLPLIPVGTGPTIIGTSLKGGGIHSQVTSPPSTPLLPPAGVSDVSSQVLKIGS